MPDQIFISYRRNDAAYVTGHINDLLRKEFGDESVFTDVDNIALGVDFRAVIDETVSQCQVFLAVIGAEWLTARDQAGKPRLDDPADFVRIEIESALKRNIPVIPLLVAGAKMPAPEELPDSLRDLAYRNGTPIRPAPDFSADMARLIKNLRRHFDAVRIAAGGDPGKPARKEPHLGDESDTDSTSAQAGEAQETTAEQFLLEEDDRARKHAELGVVQKKSRRATALWALAIVIGAGAGWLYVDRNPGLIQGLLSAGGTSTPDAEQTIGAGDTPEPADDAVAATDTDVIAPTSFSPTAITGAGEEPESGDSILPEPGSVPVAIDTLDAGAAADDAGAAPEAGIDAPGSPAIGATDETTGAAPEPAAAETGEQPGVAEEVVIDADAAAAADDEITLTPGSQRQSDASTLISEGVSLAGIGDHAAAIENFSQALELEVEPAFIYKQRGASYQALGQYEAAIQDYDRSIERNSDDLITFYNRGVSHIALEDFAAAIADFDAVIQLDPEFVDAYSRRANAHEAMGNTEAATRDRAVVSVFESNRGNPR